MKRYIFLLVLCSVTSSVVHAALTPAEKEADFSGIVASLDRRYAPIELVARGGYNPVLDARRWIEAAKRTGSDAEFHQLTLKYLASFGHSHDTLQPDGRFEARLGFTADFYDGKLLIDSIDRSALPATQYPFQIGDELLAVDGHNINQWLEIYTPLVAARKASIRRSLAANLIVRRRALLPFTPQPGQSAQVQVRRQDGSMQQYTLGWLTKGPWISGFMSVPPVYQAVPEQAMDLRYFVNRQMPSGAMSAVGVSARDPIFRLPGGFQQHLGSSPADFFFSGTYPAGGHTIGFLRIGNFHPSDSVAALAQLRTEVQYLMANTDGLVLDITRNDGGDANYQDDVAALFFATPFKTLPEQIRPTLSTLGRVNGMLESVKAAPIPDPTLVAHVQHIYDQVSSTYLQGKRLTPPLYPRNTSAYLPPAKDSAGNVIAYTRPIVLLVDESSASAAEAFAAVIKDNRRGIVAGMTTQGAGGEIYTRVRSAWYSESLLSFPGSLLVRTAPVDENGRPVYIQNAGVKPDVPLNYMTRANLLSEGKPFVEGFTKLVLSRLGTSSNSRR